MAKAKIKIVSALKEFNKSDMDFFRRMLNVLSEHGLSAKLEIKETKSYEIENLKLKVI